MISKKIDIFTDTNEEPTRQKINEFEVIRNTIQKRLDERIRLYLDENRYFVNYDEDYSVIWFLDKYIMNWNRGETLTDSMLIELFEEIKDELFLDLLQYRIVSRVIKSSGGSITRKTKGEDKNCRSLVIEETDDYILLDF